MDVKADVNLQEIKEVVAQQLHLVISIKYLQNLKYKNKMHWKLFADLPFLV